MSQFAFAVGAKVVWGERAYVIRTVSDDAEFLLEGEPNNFRNATRMELETAYVAGDLVFSGAIAGARVTQQPGRVRGGRALSDFTVKSQAAALRAKTYLDLLLTSGPIQLDRQGRFRARIAVAGEQLGDPSPPSEVTVWRWKRALEAAGGNPIGLVPRYEARGGGRRRRAPTVVEIEDRLLDEMYLTRNGDSIRNVHAQLELEVKRENQWRTQEDQLRAPSESALRAQVLRLDQIDVLTARFGIEEAKRRTHSNKAVPVVERKLERVEIDATPLDLFVIDSETDVAWGRPTFYAGIDYKTKYPWAMYVGFGDCSTSALLECIAHGIKPKSYVTARYPELTSRWMAYGVPNCIRVDNGSEFHSAAVRDAAFELGFDVEFCPKRAPNWKGSIERFLKTVNYQLMHTLPGTSLAKYYQRKDYDPLKAAVVDFQQLLKILHLWMIDIYPREMHRGIGKRPLKAWRDSK